MLKKFRRERRLPDSLDIVIISAKYGLLRADEHISNYNVRMTKERALNLHPQILDELEELISHNPYKEIFINLGKDYLPSIEGIEIAASCPVMYAQGRIGEKMRAMKKWMIRIALQSEKQKTLNDVILQK